MALYLVTKFLLAAFLTINCMKILCDPEKSTYIKPQQEWYFKFYYST
jgi:hypothetical protein